MSPPDQLDQRIPTNGYSGAPSQPTEVVFSYLVGPDKRGRRDKQKQIQVNEQKGSDVLHDVCRLPDESGTSVPF